MSAAQRDAAASIVRALRGAGHEAWFVGGCVRDIVRGVEPGDYDIVTSARPDEVRAVFPRTLAVGESFGVVLVHQDGVQYEVATYRTEGPYEDGRRPSHVEYATARADVARRDFTVNGLLMDPASGQIVDHVGGRDDIAARVIRTIGDPDARFAEDHLRMLRAARFAANLGFTLDADTRAAVARNASSIRRISGERVRDEIGKLLTRGGARVGFELLQQTGLLAEVLPEVEAMRGVEQPAQFHPEGDVWEHTMRMLAMLPAGADERLAWGALLHDVGKPGTRAEDRTGVHFHGHMALGERLTRDIARRLRFSNADADVVAALVSHHMRFMPVKQMRPNRLKRFLRMPDFALHLELHRLDCTSSHGMLDNYEFCRDTLAAMAAEELRPPPILTGHDLIAMGFTPGPVFSRILTAVEDAQLDGEISSSDEAKAYVRTHWDPGTNDRRAGATSG
jgi:poly(A) polymerase